MESIFRRMNYLRTDVRGFLGADVGKSTGYDIIVMKIKITTPSLPESKFFGFSEC